MCARQVGRTSVSTFGVPSGIPFDTCTSPDSGSCSAWWWVRCASSRARRHVASLAHPGSTSTCLAPHSASTHLGFCSVLWRRGLSDCVRTHRTSLCGARGGRLAQPRGERHSAAHVNACYKFRTTQRLCWPRRARRRSVQRDSALARPRPPRIWHDVYACTANCARPFTARHGRAFSVNNATFV